MPEITKRCSTCKEVKPGSAFSKAARNKNGLQCACRDCGARKYRHSKSPEGIAERSCRELLTIQASSAKGGFCFLCKKDLPTSEFYKNSGRPSGIDSWCKACAASRQKLTRSRQRDAANALKLLLPLAPPAVTPEGKMCSTCRAYKDMDCFTKNPKMTFGRRSICKACDYARVTSKPEIWQEGRRKISRVKTKKRTEELTDSYVSRLLKRSGTISPHEIPPSLVAVKRAHIELKRAIKEVENEKC
jgi:hypothetical protein